MLDAFGFTPNGLGNTQIFNRPSTVDNTQWMTWQKPRGVTMCSILAIAGGGGGGGGFSAAATNARGGGGAGGSSGTSRLVVSLFLLPDRLYIQVGAGGIGGAAGANGTDGGLSYVSIAPNVTTTNNLILSINGALGVAGSATAAGTAGAGGSASGTQPLAGLGNFNLVSGQNGAAGGAQTGAVGAAIAIPATGLICQGGSGGAGTTSADFAGGLCTAIAGSWLSEQRPATPAAGTFNGSGGPQIWKPFFSFGGLGGSSSNTGLGGNGGYGAYGAGGGGGGGGTTGGRGGDGGGGIVIITCW